MSVTELASQTYVNQRHKLTMYFVQRARPDSNREPPPSEGGALSVVLRAPQAAYAFATI